MNRSITKNKSVNYDCSIKKSNELSMAKLNQGLALNQIQLFAYAIYCTQQDGKTEFMRKDFISMFNLNYYHTDDAYEDSQRLSSLQFSTKDLENHKFSFTNVFRSINYENGLFTFKWNEDMIPHILELKEKYVLTDLTVTSNFRSGFSWILYEYLKAHYGYWHKELSKEALMRLFAVEDRKTYQKNTNRLKSAVLDVAINEINKFTELEIWYTEKKTGNKITGFVIHWSTGQRKVGATDKQLSLLREIHDEVDRKMFDYLALKDMEDLKHARRNILKIKEINEQVNETLTSDKAKTLIWDAKIMYRQLQKLLENDGKKRDTSFYYNWLEED